MIPSYKNKLVSDLAWSCFGPNLVDDFTLFNNSYDDTAHSPLNSTDTSIHPCHIALTPQRLIWLEQLDHNPQALIDALSTLKSQRLGLYHEALWCFFIQQDPELELIANNLAIHHNGRTIGEFDLLYYCHNTQRHYHLELAIKFYLDTEKSLNTQPVNKNLQQINRYIGPNCNDRLDLKLSHLINHQALLSQQPCAKQHLEALNINNIVKEVSVKGFIFYRHQSNTTDSGLLSSSHAKGQWQSIEEFINHSSATDLFCYINKPDWLGRIHIKKNKVSQLVKKETLIQKIHLFFSDKKSKSPIMICSVTAINENSYVERERYFITPNGWPNNRNDISTKE